MKTKNLFLGLLMATTITLTFHTNDAQAKPFKLKAEIKKMCKELGGTFWEYGLDYGCLLPQNEEIFCVDYINECELLVDGEVYNPLKRKKINKLKKKFGVKRVTSKAAHYAKYPSRKKPIVGKKPSIIAPNNIVAPNN